MKLKDHDNAITLMQSKGNSGISTLTKAVNDLAVNQQKIANNLNVIQNTISNITINDIFCMLYKFKMVLSEGNTVVAARINCENEFIRIKHAQRNTTIIEYEHMSNLNYLV
jgi:hypothetical protein